jgi:hypothetical protein
MNIVLTMAGKYNRFKLFGNKIPKYLLPLSSETMLSEVIKQIIFSKHNCKIFLIANRNDQIFYPILKSIMGKYNIDKKSLLYIDDTSSQLETALMSSELIPNKQYDNSIAFANIDTVLFNRSQFFLQLEKCKPEEGLIDTFNGESKQYSYARVGENNLIKDVSDNNVISNYACSGLYGFGSFDVFLKKTEEILRENDKSNFTNLYMKYINSGLNVYAQHVSDLNQTIVLGTPEEYVVNIHRFK